MALHIESGHPAMADVKPVDGGGVRFVAGDRTAFEVSIVDGHSIEVRSVMPIKDKDVIYDCRLTLIPSASNSVVVRLTEFDARPLAV